MSPRLPGPEMDDRAAVLWAGLLASGALAVSADVRLAAEIEFRCGVYRLWAWPRPAAPCPVCGAELAAPPAHGGLCRACDRVREVLPAAPARRDPPDPLPLGDDLALQARGACFVAVADTGRRIPRRRGSP